MKLKRQLHNKTPKTLSKTKKGKREVFLKSGDFEEWLVRQLDKIQWMCSHDIHKE